MGWYIDKNLKDKKFWSDGHTYIPNTWEAEAEGQRVQTRLEYRVTPHLKLKTLLRQK